LALVSIPGTPVLIAYQGLFWAMVAPIVRMAMARDDAQRRPLLAAAVVASTWVAFDWLSGNNVLGLPWLYPGYTQSPLLLICQIADFAGVYGITFCVVLVNALISIALIHRTRAIRAWIATA